MKKEHKQIVIILFLTGLLFLFSRYMFFSAQPVDAAEKIFHPVKKIQLSKEEYSQFVKMTEVMKGYEEEIYSIRSDCEEDGELLDNRLLEDILFGLMWSYNRDARYYNKRSGLFDWTPYLNRPNLPPEAIPLYKLPTRIPEKISESYAYHLRTDSQLEKSLKDMSNFSDWLMLRKERIDGIDFGCKRRSFFLSKTIDSLRKGYMKSALKYNSMANVFPWDSFGERKKMPPRKLEVWGAKWGEKPVLESSE